MSRFQNSPSNDITAKIVIATTVSSVSLFPYFCLKYALALPCSVHALPKTYKYITILKMKIILSLLLTLLVFGCKTDELNELKENFEPSEPIEYKGNSEPIEIETVDEINQIAQAIADIFTYSVTMLREMERTHIQPDPFERIKFNEGICTTYAILFNNVMVQKGYEIKYVSDWDLSHVWNVVILDNREIHFDVTGYDERTRGGIWIEEDDDKYLWASSHPIFDEYVYVSNKNLARMKIPIRN